MRILAVGGAGYVGSTSVETFVDAGHDVTVYDDLSTGHAAAVVRPARLVRGQIEDRAHLEHVLREEHIDAVLHCAAKSLVGESMANPGLYYRINVGGGVALLDAMSAAGVNRLVYSSTAAVYGEPQYVPVDEKHPREPINPYGASKRMVEDALMYYSSAYGLRSVPLRYFNAAGADPGGRLGPRHDPLTHLIPLVLRAAAGINPDIKVFGRDYPTPDGTAIRDYIHVADLCEAHLAAVDYLYKGGETRAFNLGVGRGFSVQEVVEAVRRVTGRDFAVVTEGRRPGDPAQLIADPSLANRVFGWKARYVDIDTIVAHNWQWQLKQMA